MDETTQEERTANDTGEGDKPESTPIIDNANQAAERLEQANKAKEELLAREEQMIAQKRLGGDSQAGIEIKEPTPEEKIKKGAMDFFEGTDIAKAIEKYG